MRAELDAGAMSAPTSACVVETGRRVSVAKPTQAIAPASTAMAKSREGGAATMPLENSAVMRAANRDESSAPASVVTAPQPTAVR